MYTAIAENMLLPFYDLLRRTSRYKCGKILEKTQYLPIDEIARLQNKNLRALITHSYRTVPYYHRIFKEKGLRPEDIKTVRDLGKLPVLKKVDVRENFADLISKNFPKNKLIPYQTGGTGSPLRFYITKDQMSWEVAAEYRAYAWADYKFGDSCFTLWGAQTDLQRARGGIARKVAGLLSRTTVVDPFFLSDEVLSDFVDIVKRLNPKVIRGYATPVYVLSRYLLEKGIDDVRPKTVITSAETLFKPMRKTIEEAFGCDVFDYYGSREIGGIAFECEEHNGYHITAENVVVEFVRDGDNVEPEQNGMIVLTGLRNYGMPLIRYENGDVGEPSKEVCNCGRGLQLMKSIMGRLSQFLAGCEKGSGRIVPLHASLMMDHFMTHLKSPPQNYRIIQESVDYLIIKIVKSKNYSNEDTGLFVKQLRDYLGTDVKIEVQFVDDLPPLPSGKRSPIISKIDAFEVARSNW